LIALAYQCQTTSIHTILSRESTRRLIWWEYRVTFRRNVVLVQFLVVLAGSPFDGFDNFSKLDISTCD
jgi:hypothetical protein